MLNDDTPTAPATAETTLWKGHTSQWVHFWYYFFCIVLAAAAIGGIPFTAGLSAIALIIPLVMWLIRWWLTRATVYELTSQRLKIASGILNRRYEELELYRVKDYAIEQPFLLRMLGLGNLSMVTSDASTPQLRIAAIADVEAVRDRLRTAVQTERDRKRVRELDVDNSSTDLS